MPTHLDNTSPVWEQVRYELAYRIGEITLFAKSFRTLSLRNHFLELTTDPEVPAPPVTRLGSDIDAIVMLSHPVEGLLPRLQLHNGYVRYVLAQYSHFYTDLSGTFKDYLSKFSSKTRNSLQRKVRRFFDSGDGSSFREYKRPDEMAEFHHLARQISALTYQEKRFQAGLPLSPSFLADLEDKARSDNVRAYLLFKGNAPIAYLCCPGANGILFYSYLGYDPRHAGLSPGTVLQYLAFESLFQERTFKAFDFTQGQGEHKRFFGTNEVRCADILLLDAGFASRFWVTFHLWLDQTSAASGRLLDSVGLKSAVKKLIRRA